jgi:hypothetical protein
VKQPQVIGILQLLSIEPGEFGKLEREQTRAQPVLSSLAGAEIRGERKCGE